MKGTTQGAERYYERQEFVKPLETWITKVSKLTKKQINKKDILDWISKITGDEINSIEKEKDRQYYLAKGKKTYRIAFEQIENVKAIVFFYEDHIESYDYPRVDDFCERYYCENNGKVRNLFFTHHPHIANRQKKGGYLICCENLLNYNLKISFATTDENLPAYKMVNEHSKCFEKLLKFNSKEFESYEEFEERSIIEKMLEVLKVMASHLNDDNVEDLYIRSDVNEYLIYSKGKLAGIRAYIDNSYVTIVDGENHWQESIIHHEDFKVKDGIILDGKNKKVTDTDIAEKIKSAIEKGKKLYAKLEKDLAAK